MSAVRICVLGPLDIRMEQGEALAFESVKSQALLAYLAVEAGRPHSRESLAGLLWPERPNPAALANLRHTLSSLRTTLGERRQAPPSPNPPLLIAYANTIQFNREAGAQVDLHEFERRVEAAEREGRENLPTRIQHLSAAVEVYKGRFMEGLALKDCLAYEDWMLLQRENLSLAFQKALRRLAAAQEAAGGWEAALSSLRRLLQEEPWDENAHRKVMRLLASHDQRGAAIGQYEHCRLTLIRELGVEPEEETVQLYEQIRLGKFREAREKGSGDACQPVKPTRYVFVGRQKQLARLHQALEQTMDGHGQVVFIAGEAGSGKTSLAWAFAHQAMERYPELLITAGRCNAFTGSEDPYLPFREAIQMLAGTFETRPDHELTQKHLRRLTEGFPDVLNTVLSFGPELIGSFIPQASLAQRIETFEPGRKAWQRDFEQALEQSLPRPAPSSSEGPGASKANRYKPIEAVTRMLIQLARLRPVIVILDDLQWADGDSLNLLHYLCKRLRDSRVVVLGAYRPQDVAFGRQTAGSGRERHPLEPVRLELQREFGEMEIDLDRAEGMAFIEALVDSEPNLLGKSFRQTLFQLTAGNPLFTVELLRSMQESGSIFRDPSGRWVEDDGREPEKLPARVEAVIAERIGRLPASQQALLRAASVEGETFSAEAVARTLNLPTDPVIRMLSGPLGREQQIVTALESTRLDTPGAGARKRLSRYRFGHILFQRYLYNRLDPVERSALHEATGMALEDLYGPAAGQIALQLARHFEQAGLNARAAEYLLAAGKQAIQLAAHQQAKAHYDHVLETIRRLPDSPERTRLEVKVQLARGAPLFATEGWGSPKAVRAVNRAIELLAQSGENGDDPEILLALYFQADHFNAQNNIPEALARVELLLRRVSEGADRPYQVLAHAAAGQVYLFAGQLKAAAEHLEQAISGFRAEDQEFLTGVTGYNLLHASLTWNAYTLWLMGYPDLAQAASRQVIEAARQQPHPFYLAPPLSVAGALFSAMQNEAERAGAYAEECLRLPESDGLRMARTLSETVLGWAQVQQGDEAGLALLHKGIRDWKSRGSLTILPFLEMLLADALSLTGRTEAGLEIITTLFETIERTGRRLFEAYLHWLQGEILARAQRSGQEWYAEESPAACFERAIEAARRQQARSLELRAATSLARCLGEEGRASEAYRLLKEIHEQFDAQAESRDLREARKMLAQLSASGELR